MNYCGRSCFSRHENEEQDKKKTPGSLNPVAHNTRNWTFHWLARFHWQAVRSHSFYFNNRTHNIRIWITIIIYTIFLFLFLLTSMNYCRTVVTAVSFWSHINTLFSDEIRVRTTHYIAVLLIGRWCRFGYRGFPFELVYNILFFWNFMNETNAFCADGPQREWPGTGRCGAGGGGGFTIRCDWNDHMCVCAKITFSFRPSRKQRESTNIPTNPISFTKPTL